MGDTAKIWEEYLDMEKRYLEDTGIEDVLAAKQVFSTFLQTLREAQEQDLGPWTRLEELERETGHGFSRFLDSFLQLLFSAGLYRSLSDACDSLCAAFPAGCRPVRVTHYKIEALLHLGEAAEAMQWCDERILSVSTATPYVEVQDVLIALLAAGRSDIALQLCEQDVHLVERCRMNDAIRALVTAMRTVYDAVGDRRKVARLSWLLSENERQERTAQSEGGSEAFFQGKIRESRAYYEKMMQDGEEAPYEEGSTNARVFLFPGRRPEDEEKPDPGPEGK